MSILLNGDCLELMEGVGEQSVDLIFCDLPYGQTSCRWDCKIDLSKLWSEILRVKKLHTPIFFTTTTKFGVEIINSSPKNCPFRYDLVWVKSACVGFLSAKKMPMRKHEMLYVFYEKLPFYDLSSHTHKFIKEGKKSEGDKGNECYGKFSYYNNGEKGYEPPLPVSVVNKEELDEKYKNKGGLYSEISRNGLLKAEPHYDPPLPVSVVKEPNTINTLYGDEVEVPDYVNKRNKKTGMSAYDPPLPVSVVKEPHSIYGFNPEDMIDDRPSNVRTSAYEPPLPVSVVKEDIRKDKHETAYGENIHYHNNQQKNGESIYDPPLPVSVVKEDYETCNKPKRKMIYGNMEVFEPKRRGEPRYDPPLPVSVVKEDKHTLYGEIEEKGIPHTTTYEPPLPTTMLEIKSTRGKHSTEKPVALMEWLLKYFSKEGDVVLDPTMGSGSTGVACKNMKRNFIGIELDPEIYEVAVNRIED